MESYCKTKEGIFTSTAFQSVCSHTWCRQAFDRCEKPQSRLNQHEKAIDHKTYNPKHRNHSLPCPDGCERCEWARKVLEASAFHYSVKTASLSTLRDMKRKASSVIGESAEKENVSPTSKATRSLSGRSSTSPFTPQGSHRISFDTITPSPISSSRTIGNAVPAQSPFKLPPSLQDLESLPPQVLLALAAGGLAFHNFLPENNMLRPYLRGALTQFVCKEDRDELLSWFPRRTLSDSINFGTLTKENCSPHMVPLLIGCGPSVDRTSVISLLQMSAEIFWTDYSYPMADKLKCINRKTNEKVPLRRYIETNDAMFGMYREWWVNHCFNPVVFPTLPLRLQTLLLSVKEGFRRLDTGTDR